MPRQRRHADAATVRDLGLYIENDGDLYRRQQQPIEKNLLLKGQFPKRDRDELSRQAARAFETEHPSLRQRPVAAPKKRRTGGGNVVTLEDVKLAKRLGSL